MSKDNWIQTYCGHQFFIDGTEFDNNIISVLDIAHALSNICRFGGMSKGHYSVAQHSVLVSYACPTMPMAGLLHDASEAYLGDVVTQLKRQLPDFKKLEQQLQSVLCFRFNLDDGSFDHPEVKHADMMLLATEKRDVLRHSNLFWSKEMPEPAAEKINLITPFEAKRMFLNRYYELAGIKQRWENEDQQDAEDAKLRQEQIDQASQSKQVTKGS